MDSQTEHAIARGLREGRTDAWQALYDAYARHLWQAVARQMGADAAVDVADVVQETFLAAARTARQYDATRGSLRQWLGGIARRQVALYYRHRRRRDPARETDEATGRGARATRWLDAGEPPPTEAAERRELAGQVQQALTRLPEDYESLLRAKYFDEVSVEELAGEHASTATAIRSKLARARRAFCDMFFAKAPS